MIDLRSDTMTRPTARMLQALAELSRDDIGDDVYGEVCSCAAIAPGQARVHVDAAMHARARCLRHSSARACFFQLLRSHCGCCVSLLDTPGHLSFVTAPDSEAVSAMRRTRPSMNCSD